MCDSRSEVHGAALISFRGRSLTNQISQSSFSGVGTHTGVRSPDWAKLKDILRRLPTLPRDTFDSAVALAMDNISTSDISAWTSFAGYSVSST